MAGKREHQSEKEKAIARAEAWWKEKDPDRVYVCDACNSPLEWNQEGSSLIGSWMRCKRCTDRLFSLAGRIVHVSYKGRRWDIPLEELVWDTEFSDDRLLGALAHRLAEPAVLGLRVKRLPSGDIHVSKGRLFGLSD